MEWLQVQDARDQGMTDQLRHQRNEIDRNQGCEEGKPNYKMTVIKSEWTTDMELKLSQPVCCENSNWRQDTFTSNSSNFKKN